MRVVDDLGPESEPMRTRALALAEEATGVKGWENMKVVRTVTPQLLESMRARRAAAHEP